MARTNVKDFSVYVATEDTEGLKTFAKSKGFKSVSDYIRSLIDADLESAGKQGLTEVASWGRKANKDKEVD